MSKDHRNEDERLVLVRVDPKQREKPLKVETNYCPWCGVKYV